VRAVVLGLVALGALVGLVKLVFGGQAPSRPARVLAP
jgi:hypothetical protein